MKAEKKVALTAFRSDDEKVDQSAAIGNLIITNHVKSSPVRKVDATASTKAVYSVDWLAV